MCVCVCVCVCVRKSVCLRCTLQAPAASWSVCLPGGRDREAAMSWRGWGLQNKTNNRTRKIKEQIKMLITAKRPGQLSHRVLSHCAESFQMRRKVQCKEFPYRADHKDAESNFLWEAETTPETREAAGFTLLPWMTSYFVYSDWLAGIQFVSVTVN